MALVQYGHDRPPSTYSMVHVMSEVKRYDEYECGVHEVPEFGEYVKASDFDAQRLRADTAEALSVTNLMIDVVPGSDGMGHEVYAKSVAEVGLLISNLYLDAETAGERLAAAEQRIAELLVMLRQAWVDDHVSAADCRKIDAALNPNPEAENHE